MAIVTQTVDYSCDSTQLQGFLAYDNSRSGPRPLVLIAHAWGGRDEFVNNKAKAIAELGYAGFAIDMYGTGIVGNSVEENSALMKPLMQDRALLQRRITAALTTAKTQTVTDKSRIAVMGFCFGGLCALDLARTGADLKGAITFHALFAPAPNIPTPTIKAKILLLHGSNDPMATMHHAIELKEELNAAKADWQLLFYGGCQHAFTNPAANAPDMGLQYNASAERRSWLALRNFLEEIFA